MVAPLSDEQRRSSKPVHWGHFDTSDLDIVDRSLCSTNALKERQP
jgi:hypothetical protein